MFSTAADNQTSVEIHVLQGERQMANDNKSLGRFTLSDIPPAPRGIPQIEVSFDLDANGIVNVRAKDLGTGKEQRITITSNSGLSDDEIDRMVKEAELNAEADKQRKEQVEIRNEADQLVFTTEKTLKEVEGKIDQAEIDRANEAKDTVKKALEGGNIEEIKSAKDALSEIIQQISVKLYEQAAQAQQNAQGAAEGQEPKKDNVVDADYEVVDDKK